MARYRKAQENAAPKAPTPARDEPARTWRVGALDAALLALGAVAVAAVVLRRPSPVPRLPSPGVPAPSEATSAFSPGPEEVNHPLESSAGDSAPLDPPPSAVAEVMPDAACPLTRSLGLAFERGSVSSSWYEGGGAYDAARQEQEGAGAPLLIYVRTDWCPYCKKLDAEFLADHPIEQYLRSSVVKIKVNPEQDVASQDLARRLGATGYPSLFVAVPGGTPERISPYGEGTSYRHPAEFIGVFEGQMAREARSLLFQGHAQRQAGNAAAAVATLDRAVRLKPDDPQAYVELGLAHAAAAQVDAAFEDLARAAQLRPEDATPFVAAEQVLSRQDRWDETTSCWTSFIERNPSNGRGFLGRARALYRKGMPGLSGVDAARACELGVPEACRRAAVNRPLG